MNDANYVFSVAVYKNLLTFRNWRLYLTDPAPAGRVAAALFLTELQVSESEARINAHCWPRNCFDACVLPFSSP